MSRETRVSRRRLFEMFAKLTESASVAVIVMDPRDRIVYWNRAATTILGFEREEAIGQLLHDLLAPERYRKAVYEAFHDFETSERDPGAGRTVELKARCKDGREVPVELSVSTQRLRGGRHAVGILRDTTERARAEAALREAKKRAEQLFRLVPCAVFTVDRERRITSANGRACAALGYSEEELCGQQCRAFTVDPCNDDCRLFEEHVEKPFYKQECLFRTKDGRILRILKNADVLRNSDGEVTGGVESFNDITDHHRTLKDLEDARTVAEQSEQAKSEFLANMSHEIRTPMNAVIGMTDVLLDTTMTEEQREIGDMIRRSGRSLLAIINDVLDFSKIESGKFEIESEPFPVRPCVEDAMDLVARGATDKGLDIVYQFEGGTPEWAVGDITRIRQILLNLLGNAVKFTEHGEILVKVRAEPEPDDAHMFEFSVHDTGIGIPPERMDRLFHSFSQVDASTTRRYGGTGLGLAICQRFSEMMGGWIRCESEVGKGSTFRFAVRARAARGPLPSFLTGGHESLRGRRVLIVDDNFTSREQIARLVESWEMIPCPFRSGEEALDQVRFGDPFEAAIIDLEMPEMDGMTLIRGIRLHRSRTELPILLLTPMGGQEPARNDGADEPAPEITVPVAKPLKPQSLYEALIEAMNQSPAPGKDPRATLTPESRPQEPPAPEMIPADPPPTAEPAPPTPDGPSDAPLRILVVEDNQVNQMVVLKILKRLGLGADVVGNGQEAIEALERRPYDVILMDVQMPVMDGLEATRRIRAREWAEGQPNIIAVTANAMAQDRESCLAAGMDDFVSKPVRMELLAAAIEKAEVKPSPASESQSAPATGGLIDRQMINDLLGDGEGADEIFAELVSLFVETSPEVIESIRQAVKASDADRVRQYAHNLKGSAATLGAMALSESSFTMEKMGRSGKLEGAAEALGEIEKNFEDAKQELLSLVAVA